MNNHSSTRTTPCSAPLALRVGVVGHRPNRLRDANLPQLSSLMREILEVVKNEVLHFKTNNPGLYSEDAPVLRAISPLAEGTDRIFAELALDAGYELCCIMPFHRAEFENDFVPGKSLEDGSLEKFRKILTRAEETSRLTCFELDGNRKNESLAYTICGKTVLNQSDILFVVWDGEFQGKKGGTEDTFKEALQQHIPILWIDARADHNWQIIDNREEFHFTAINERAVPSAKNTLTDIRDAVTGILQLTHPKGIKDEIVSGETIKIDLEKIVNLKKFYSRRKPWFTMAVIWKCFRDILGDNKFPRPVFTLGNFEEAVKGEWPEDTSTPVARVVDTLRSYYAWPDKLAVLYSDRYRSAFIITFFLAAIAVGMALLPLVFGWKPHTVANNLCIWIEIALMIAIIAIVYFGNRNRWHERWIDYRLMAESVRHLRLVAPLGGSRPFLHPPAYHKTYGQPESSWVAWYVRAVERFLGVPSVVVDKNHLQYCLTHLSDYIGGQIKYHNVNQIRCNRIHRNLYILGLVMLGFTIISCLIHLFMGILLHRFLPSWVTPDRMTFLCGVLPALGAALAGINFQGEFKRISKRSKAMHDQLMIMKQTARELLSDIHDPIKFSDEQFSVKASEITGKAARLMTNEVLDWRVVFMDHPLNASV